MDNRNKGLGKGMSAIFGGDISQMLDDIQSGPQDKTQVPVDLVRPNPYQPRKVFDDASLEELKVSIQNHGVFTPILVKKSVHGYDLVAGERRLRASKLAGLAEIPAILVDFDDQEMMEIALLENIQRENLNAIEEARAYQQMIKSLGYTQEQLARRVGKSREHITNIMRLLKLPEDVQQMVVDKQLSMGHVRALLSLKDADSMRRIARTAAASGLSVRKVEQMVKEAGKVKAAPPEESMFVKEARRQLEEYFQTGVRISGNTIAIHFENDQDLTRILELLSLTEPDYEAA